MTGSWDPASEAGTRCIFFPLGHTPCPYPASPGDTPCPPTVTHGFSTPRGWFENYSRGTSNALRPGCCRAARTQYWQPGILALTEEVSRHEHRATTATLQAASATTPTVHCRSVSGATVTCLSHLVGALQSSAGIQTVPDRRWRDEQLLTRRRSESEKHSVEGGLRFRIWIFPGVLATLGGRSSQATP